MPQKTFFPICIISLLLIAFAITTHQTQAQPNLSQKFSGHILLQVEQNGEAWYVNPEDNQRHFMGKPKDAFQLMRDLGVGITTNKLNQIPVGGLDNLTGQDKDNDGLPDKLENALNTDPNQKDTDGDGYNDQQELKGNYNPNGSGKLSLDNNFAQNQAGQILLQVENNGEAWYINPENHKRYFLGRPGDAFQIMRRLGQGISDSDLEEIKQQKENNNSFKGECKVGKEAKGGVIAECNDQGEPTLIAMKQDIAQKAKWGCKGEKVGADSESDGEYNTQKIIKNCQEEDIAARLCAESTEGEYEDWYLPSRKELSLLYSNKDKIGGFSSGYYWSSLEPSSSNAWFQNFKNGVQISYTKNYSNRVRCLRSF